MVRAHLDLIHQHTVAIDRLSERIEEDGTVSGLPQLIGTISGIVQLTDVVLAETSADLSRFPGVKRLAS